MHITLPTWRSLSVALFAVVSSSGIATAQQPEPTRFTIRPFGAAFVPTGSHADAFKYGPSAGIQGTVALSTYISAVGTFSWTSTEEKSFDNKVNVFQYDIGAEAGISKPLTGSLAIHPFLGLGMGQRAYDYKDIESDAQFNVAGYGAGGAELRMGRFGWRVEVRDYVSSYKGLSGELESRQARNDLSISSGFAMHF